MNPNGLLLDLHGRRMEEAISDVTVFLDRIRRTYYSSVRPSSSSVASEGRGGIPLYVTVITGSGSVRSLCGAVLFVSASYCVTNKWYEITLLHLYSLYYDDSIASMDLFCDQPSNDYSGNEA